MTEQICGRDVTVVEPKKPAFANHRRVSFKGGFKPNQEPQARFIVSGVNHKNGQPIRFKSRENAERHIRNMGLAQ